MSRLLSSKTAHHFGLLILRLYFGLSMAFAHGFSKLGDLPGFISKVDQMGFPLATFSGSFAALAESIGGLLIAAGLFTRSAATALLATMMGAAFIVHGADPFGKKELALGYAVVALAISLLGPGRYALDQKIQIRKK